MRNNYVQKITLIEVSTPKSADPKEEIEWICKSFDLDPEHNKLAFDIFLHLVNATRKGEGIKTIDIVKQRSVSQAAVVYHMNAFVRSGIVIKKGLKYFLTGKTLSATMDVLEENLIRRMKTLKEIARKIDNYLI